MPRFANYPTPIESYKTLTIRDLIRWEYLIPNQRKSGTIHWSRNGENTGRISIAANMDIDCPYIVLDYQCNGNPVKYRIDLVSKPSNLGKGVVWYFECPNTQLNCRKLYLLDTKFLHRKAFRGYFYEKQIASKHIRSLDKQFGAYYELDHVYETIYRKHFKKFYAGKPTKRYKKLQRKIELGERLLQRGLSNTY